MSAEMQACACTGLPACATSVNRSCSGPRVMLACEEKLNAAESSDK